MRLKRLIRLKLWLGLTIVGMACSANPIGEPPTGGPGVNPPGTDVEVLREPVLQDDAFLPEQQGPAEDGALLSVDVYEDRLVFHYETGTANPFTVGQVVSGVEGGGYLRRVMSIDELESGVFELGTQHAQLTDLFRDVHFRVEFEPPEGTWVQPSDDSEVGGRTDSLGEKLDLFPPSALNELCNLRGADVNMELSATPSFMMDVDIGWRRPLKMQVEFGGEVRAAISATFGEVSVECERMLSEEIRNRFRREFTSTVWVGWVPVISTHTIAPTGAVKITLAGDVGTVSTSAEWVESFTAGATYDEGWDSYSTSTRTRTATPPTVDREGNLSATMRLSGGITYLAKLYDLAGPEMALTPFVELKSEVDTDCVYSTNLDAGLDMRLAAKAEVPVLDISVAEADFSFNLFTGNLYSDTGMFDFEWCTEENHCDGASQCDECNRLAGCGWCRASNSCVLAEGGECSGGIETDINLCRDCASPTSCLECVQVGGCGWCNGGCVNLSDDEELSSCGGEYASFPAACM